MLPNHSCKLLLSSMLVGMLVTSFSNESMAQADFGFNFSHAYSVDGLPESVGVGDVNNDGLNDLIVVNNSFSNLNKRNHVLIYEQDESANLFLAAALEYTDSDTSGRGLELVDLDGDDDLEIVIGYFGALSIINYQNSEYVIHQAVGGEGNRVLESIDLNQDGFKDMVGLHTSQGINIYMCNTEGSLVFDHVIDIPNATGDDDIEVADLNGDAIEDLAVMNGGSGLNTNLAVYEGDGVAGFTGQTNYQLGSFEFTGNGAIADINNDGRQDVLLSRDYNSPNHLWLFEQSNNGDLNPVQTVPSAARAQVMETADINQDGLDDVVLLHRGGNGSFLGYHLQAENEQAENGLQDEVLISLPVPSQYEAEALALGDLNNDGCTDAAVADFNQGVLVFYGEGCLREADLSVSIRTRRDIVVVDMQHLSGETVDSAFMNISFSSDVSLNVTQSQGPVCTVVLVQENQADFECNIGMMSPSDIVRTRFNWASAGQVTIDAEVSSELVDADPSSNQATAVSGYWWPTQ